MIGGDGEVVPPASRTSGPKTVENPGLGVPSATASTSRSTPVSCSAISPAEANRRPGSRWVARASSRARDSCCRSTGTASGRLSR